MFQANTDKVYGSERHDGRLFSQNQLTDFFAAHLSVWCDG